MRIFKCIRNRCQILGLTVIFLCNGCATDLPRPNIHVSSDPTKEWSKLLDQVSTSEGIDWDTLEANRPVLERYIAWTGTVGPQTNRKNKTPFPKRGRTNRRFVHFVNAYNAWILYSHLEHDRPSKLDYMKDSNGFPPRTRAFIDGEYMTFAHIKFERLLADFQEPRVHFMLHELYADTPQLQFWHYNTWKTRSDQALRDFINKGGIRRSNDGWTVHPVFIDFQQDFVDWSLHDSVCEFLIDYTTGERRQWLKTQQDNCSLQVFEVDSMVPKMTSSISPSSTEENSP